MARFHIGKSGKSAACNAKKGNCPLGGESEHFSSREEAQKAAEGKMGKEFKTTSSSKKPNTEFKLPNGKLENVGTDSIKWTGGNLIRLREASGEKYVSKKTIIDNISADLKQAVNSNHLPSGYKYTVKEDITGKIVLTAHSSNHNPLDHQELSITEDSRPRINWSNYSKQDSEVAEKLDNIESSYQSSEEVLNKKGVLSFYKPKTNFDGIVNINYPSPQERINRAENKLKKEISIMGGNKDIDLSAGKVTPETINEAMKKNPRVKRAIIEIAEAETHKKSYEKVLNQVYASNKELFEAESKNNSPDNANQRAKEEFSKVNNLIETTKTEDNNNIKSIENKLESPNSSINDVFTENDNNTSKKLSRKIHHYLQYSDTYSKYSKE